MGKVDKLKAEIPLKAVCLMVTHLTHTLSFSLSRSLSQTHKTIDCPLTIEQDEFEAVATLQRVLQYVLQGPVEEQDLLPALGLPETSAALLGHVVERQQRCCIFHHTLVNLLTHTRTHTRTLTKRQKGTKKDTQRYISWTNDYLKSCSILHIHICLMSMFYW